MKAIAYLFFFFLLVSGLSANAQDVIYKSTGEEINAKVVEITPTSVIFKQPALYQDSLFTLARQDVFMVKFANGIKELMQSPEEETAPAPATRTPAQMLQQGRLDARRYYTGNKGIAGGAIAGLLFFPSIAVVAAVPPRITPKDVPEPNLLTNPHYYRGFRSQAHKRKVGKVAIGGGVALATMVLLTAMSFSSQ